MLTNTCEGVAAILLPTGRVVRDWGELAVDSWVDVVADSEPLTHARVDAKTEDGSILWLVEAGTGRRTLRLKTDPLVLYRTSH
ncbi:hypothetical protein ACIQTZ_12315 [Paenarthrobacter sp. NPDC090520]|uniref:hypothetical protein n=1 Tax=Paenarthrobacter sp. NPDC090520 TaxID=3364382 RepID=UPI00381E51C4